MLDRPRLFRKLRRGPAVAAVIGLFLSGSSEGETVAADNGRLEYDRAFVATCAPDLKIRLLVEAAKKGSADAAFTLAEIHVADSRLERRWFNRATAILRARANRGDMLAMITLVYGWDDRLALPSDRETREAFHRTAMKQAARGDGDAMLFLEALYGDKTWPRHNATEAEKWLERAEKIAEKSNDSAFLLRFGQRLQATKGTEERGNVTVLRAAEMGNPAAVNRAWQFLWETNSSKGVALLRKAAEAGDLDAQASLAELLSSGRHGTPLDLPAARVWYERAARAGHSNAQVSLGTNLADGTFGRAQPAAALDWFAAAAEQGDCLGYEALGKALFVEAAAIPDPAAQYQRYTASRNALLAAARSDRADTNALQVLAYMFWAGSGGPADRAEACRFHQRAMELGSLDAKIDWAKCLSSGSGVAQDVAAALALLNEVTNDSTLPALIRSMAKYQIGVLYEGGVGVTQNYDLALRLFNAAADAGYALALEHVGDIRAEGRIATQDFERAYRLYSLAVAQGSETAIEKRDTMILRLSPPQIQRAQADAARVLGAFRSKGEAAAVPSPTPHPQIERKVERGPSFGTGFAVTKDGVFLTSAHVVSGCSSVAILGKPAKILTSDKSADLALLKVNTSLGAVAVIRGEGAVRAGDSVVVVGFPLQGLVASELSVTTGAVSATAGPNNDARFIQISAPIQPGNSGGPLLDRSGEVIGVVTSTLSTVRLANAIGTIPQNVNFAISLPTLRSFLAANGVRTESGRRPTDATAADVAARARTYTVPVLCNPLPPKEVTSQVTRTTSQSGSPLGGQGQRDREPAGSAADSNASLRLYAQTLEAMRHLAIGIEAYAVKNNKYPLADVPLARQLEPEFIKDGATPARDAWGGTLRYIVDSSRQHYRIICAMKNGLVDGESLNFDHVFVGSTADSTKDIILGDGQFVQYPAAARPLYP